MAVAETLQRSCAPSLLPGPTFVRTLLAMSWSFASVSHVQWPQYHLPSLIITASISALPVVAHTGNLTICIEKLLCCTWWGKTVLHNYKWCAAAAPNRRTDGGWTCDRQDVSVHMKLWMKGIRRWKIFILYVSEEVRHFHVRSWHTSTHSFYLLC